MSLFPQPDSESVSGILGLLGISADNLSGFVGVTCTPITGIGAGSGSSCQANPVCCDDNSFVSTPNMFINNISNRKSGILGRRCLPRLCSRQPQPLNSLRWESSSTTLINRFDGKESSMVLEDVYTIRRRIRYSHTLLLSLPSLSCSGSLALIWVSTLWSSHLQS